jgi:hypothetical protein
MVLRRTSEWTRNCAGLLSGGRAEMFPFFGAFPNMLSRDRSHTENELNHSVASKASSFRVSVNALKSERQRIVGAL